ncbi:MAG TPA: 5-(carboxyamino)imidazole ribonucleotide synthase [Salinarimonas sp.]|nr:5-(carboxyamino)imidazole ribonucleotide synthase [Salinarimonas sp.]
MATIGVIGGGQLCRMMGEEIRRRGLPHALVALDPTPGCPAAAAGVLREQIPGDFKSRDRILELAAKSDVVTFEIELAGSATLEEIERTGKPVHPSSKTLAIIQDKLVQKAFLRQQGLPVPDFRAVGSKADLLAAGRDWGWPLMLKARRDAYDGRGNRRVAGEGEVDAALAALAGRELMVERWVDFGPSSPGWHAFSGEVSVIAARALDGTVRTYPVGENFHDESILDMTIVPARVGAPTARRAEEIATQTLKALAGAGVFGIEMFVTRGGEVLINEIAPRVHNSGHYTIEACRTSQFEQHVRAITGMPLGETTLLYAAVMVNLLGAPGLSGPYRWQGVEAIASLTDVRLHDYGKRETAPRRKIGHLTVTGVNSPAHLGGLIHRARQVREFLVQKKA